MILGLAAGWFLYGWSLRALALAILVVSALVISLTDFRYQVVPDRLTLPGIAIGLLIAAISAHITLANALIGGVTGFGIFYGLAWAGEKLLKKESMGGGDIKLAAMLGVFLGWQQLGLAVFLAAVSAVTYLLLIRLVTATPLRSRVPFGPFLAYSAVASFVFGERAIALYLGLLAVNLD